jgi:hypothetical protein
MQVLANGNMATTLNPNFEFRLLGAFAKFRKATTSFIMSVCLPIRPHGTTRRIFVENDICVFIFEKSVEKIEVLLRPDKQ